MRFKNTGESAQGNDDMNTNCSFVCKCGSFSLKLDLAQPTWCTQLFDKQLFLEWALAPKAQTGTIFCNLDITLSSIIFDKLHPI